MAPFHLVLYVHPNQRQRLLRLGYPETELAYVSNGFDLHGADEVPAQEKVYDAVWTGRVHQQKGIDDLLSTPGYLAKSVPDFRAVLIGNVGKRAGSASSFYGAWRGCPILGVRVRE